MYDYKKSMITEQKELEGHTSKLIDFMHSDEYAELVPVHQGLLMVKLTAAENLLRATERNIEVFKRPVENDNNKQKSK